MPMSLRQATLAAFLSFAITACAQPPASPTPTVTPSATHRDHAESAPVTSAKEAPAMSEPVTDEPERGPAIPAAELRKRLLALFGSFRSLKDLERGHVEGIMQSPLVRRSGMEDGYQYFGKTTEGWNYRIAVERLGRMDQPPTVTIFLNNGADPDAGQYPTHCTLEFEPLAKELVAMGYERGARAYNRGGDMTWGFGRDSATQAVGFGVGVIVYPLKSDAGSPLICIGGFRIGGGPLDE